MIYVPLSMARPGMKLARSVMSPNGYFALLQDGEVLTTRYIQRLAYYDIDGIYIALRGTEGIEPNSIIDPRARQEMSKEFRSLYNNFYNRPYISTSAVSSTKRLAGSIVDNVLTSEEHLLDMMEIKSYDNYTCSHSLNVGILGTMLATELGIVRSRLESFALCALMHDIGKLDIPITIINKRGPVTPEEFEIIKTHPAKGTERLSKCYNLPVEVLPGILSHHEKYDGSGYPNGQAGKDIPFFGRILSVVDVYDALTSQRSYRNAWHPKDAMEYIVKGAGKQFDADLVKVFARIICVYPTGTLIKLSDDTTAVVVKNSKENTLRPRIRLLEDSQLGKKGYELDLLNDVRYASLDIKDILGASDGEAFDLPSAMLSSDDDE